jgi:hypothetical protein
MRQCRYGMIAALWVVGLNIPGLCAQSALNFVPIPPCRLADTRNPLGSFGGPSLQAATPRSFPVYPVLAESLQMHQLTHSMSRLCRLDFSAI